MRRRFPEPVIDQRRIANHASRLERPPCIPLLFCILSSIKFPTHIASEQQATEAGTAFCPLVVLEFIGLEIFALPFSSLVVPIPVEFVIASRCFHPTSSMSR